MSESELHPEAEAAQAEASENARPANEPAGDSAGEPRNELAGESVAPFAPSEPKDEAPAGAEESVEASAEQSGDEQPAVEAAADEPPAEEEAAGTADLEAGQAEEPEAGQQPPDEAAAEEAEPDEDPEAEEAGESQAGRLRSMRQRDEPAEAAPAANDDGRIFVDEPIPTHASVPASDPELEDVDAAAIEQPTEEDEEFTDTPFDKIVAKARKLPPERIRTILESLLFVTDKPLSEEAMRGCTGLDVPVIREQLEKLQGGYRDGVRGIVLHEVAGGWQFRTDPTNAEFVRRFLKVKPQRLTRAALETLAIIAYRQPVTRPEIEDVRAVDCGAVIKALLERRLIKIIGKRDEPGRPLLYGTTTEFLEFFNLRDLGSLPTLREFQELSEESREIVEQETGQAEAPKGTDTIVADLKDNTFEQKLAETTAEADDALAELELALADTETKAKETAEVLNPRAPQSEQQTDEDGDDDAE